MKLIFLYGSVASGKFTVARELAALTGYALFHNHLIVDAVAAVFPFGSERFVRLREQFWLTMFREAAEADRSTIFTFAPEATVSGDFPRRAAEEVERGGGELHFVRLLVAPDEQERRIGNTDRARFGKMRSVPLLRQLREQFDSCEAAMPAPVLTINTTLTDPASAAHAIIAELALAPANRPKP
jgi:hypothetical protein